VSLFQNILIIVILIAGAGFLSLTEIALAGARKVKLKILAESGEERAQKVLDLQEQSADFFAASQIGLNAAFYSFCRFNAETHGHDRTRKNCGFCD
jgi:CBS domain containing-hemolysin-like protein